MLQTSELEEIVALLPKYPVAAATRSFFDADKDYADVYDGASYTACNAAEFVKRSAASSKEFQPRSKP